jgi:hypothetical protein
MKKYVCDLCEEEFDSKYGMIDGVYSKERIFQFREATPSIKKPFILKTCRVRKTLKLFDYIRVDTALAPQETDIKKDLCPNCIKLLEKP